MHIISSRKTYFYKKVFPVLWFGFLGIMMALMLFLPPALGHGHASTTPPLPFFFIPLIMMAFGYFLMKKLAFDLMDEVYDDGNRLIVKFGDAEDTIMLSNIINVSHTIAINPPRLVLTLRAPCRFGKKVAFCPPTKWADVKTFGFTNTLADDLVARVDEARRLG